MSLSRKQRRELIACIKRSPSYEPNLPMPPLTIHLWQLLKLSHAKDAEKKKKSRAMKQVFDEINERFEGEK